MQALVEAAGLAIETYASAGEFLAAYDGRRPGCLVLDVRLRGENGSICRTSSAGGCHPAHHRHDGLCDVPPPFARSRAARATSCGSPCRRRSSSRSSARPSSPIARRARSRSARHRHRSHRASHPARASGHGTPAVGKSSKEIGRRSESASDVEGHRREVLRKMEVVSAVQLARAIAAARRP